MPHKLNLRKMRGVYEEGMREEERRIEEKERREREWKEREERRKQFQPERERQLKEAEFPDDIDRPNVRAWEERPTPFKVDEGVNGIIEKTMSYKNADRWLVAVGYVVGTDPLINSMIGIYFKDDPEWPMYAFDLESGAVTTEPHERTPKGLKLSFFGYPRLPAVHRTFTPHDPNEPDRAFEPHVRKLVGGSIRKMRTAGKPEDEINRYKSEFDSFICTARDLFVKAKQY